jgi:hypothetical protein
MKFLFWYLTMNYFRFSTNSWTTIYNI